MLLITLWHKSLAPQQMFLLWWTQRHCIFTVQFNRLYELPVCNNKDKIRVVYASVWTTVTLMGVCWLIDLNVTCSLSSLLVEQKISPVKTNRALGFPVNLSICNQKINILFHWAFKTISPFCLTHRKRSSYTPLMYIKSASLAVLTLTINSGGLSMTRYKIIEESILALWHVLKENILSGGKCAKF